MQEALVSNFDTWSKEKADVFELNMAADRNTLKIQVIPPSELKV